MHRKTTLDEFIKKLRNPQNYTGLEINANKKGFRTDLINICLIFPDVYEIGMSHYGIKFLYSFLKANTAVNVERAFLPDRESIKIFKEYHYPLFSLESKTPLKKFDLVGFSVLSEMNYTNILQILDLAEIPLLQKEREDGDPLIMAGGISIAANPEPMRQFFDLVAIGEGEVILTPVVSALSKTEFKRKTREDQLKSLSSIDGVYVPSQIETRESGLFKVPVFTGKRIKKQVFDQQEELKYFPDLIVPISDTVFNRLDVEIARGCPQNCRFCQAKAYYAPFRVGDAHSILNYIRQGLKKTGFDSVSLTSLSSGDYPGIEGLFSSIEEILPPCVSLSVSSLRPSSVSDEMLHALSHIRKTGITIVAEAGTQRLRDIINKDVTDRDIHQAVKTALENNWQRIKLYFMIGLPKEEIQDIWGIIRLLKEINLIARKAGRTLRLHVSFSSFVPKPHTALQRAERESSESLFNKIHLIKSELARFKNIDLDFHNVNRSMVETILARGDERVGELIYRAFLEGEILSAWDHHFQYNIWDELIESLGLNVFLSEIRAEQILPWDFIQLNFKEDFLAKEKEKSLSLQPTPSCNELDCGACQGCYFGKRDIAVRTRPGYRQKVSGKSAGEFKKVRLFYEKVGYFTCLSHLSMMKYIERIIRMSQLDFKFSGGYHPRIKMTALPSLPVFASGLNEVVEVFLSVNVSDDGILNLLNDVSADFKFKKIQSSEGWPSLMKDIRTIVYDIALGRDRDREELVRPYLTEQDVPVWQENGLSLKLDYRDNGDQRFARIYAVLDPARKNTHCLTRRKVIFKHDYEH